MTAPAAPREVWIKARLRFTSLQDYERWRSAGVRIALTPGCPEVLDVVIESEAPEALQRLVADLIDPAPCSLDHDGACQAHAWFDGGECPQARAKRWAQ